MFECGMENWDEESHSGQVKDDPKCGTVSLKAVGLCC